MASRTPRQALTLQHFMLQSSILQAYRKAVRATRPLPDPQTRRETLDFLRGELQRSRYLTDIELLQHSLSAFQRTVKILVPSFGLGGLSPDQGAKLVGRVARSREDTGRRV